MNNIFYDIEDNCYRTYPNGDRANNKEIHKSIQKLQKENQELKKQLEEWEQYLINAKEMLSLQGHDGNYNYDNYMLGLYNGMEYVIALFEKRNPIYKDGKNIEFLNDKNQQKEFIEYLKQMLDSDDDNFSVVRVRDILSKYNEITGVK